MTSYSKEDYFDSNTSLGEVSLVNNSHYDNIICEYEVWFKAGTSFGKDFSLIVNNNMEINLNNVNKDDDLKITDSYISVGKMGSDAESNIQNWTFSFRHYILKDEIQNANIGQEFKGHIYFKTKRCYEGKAPGVTLLDSCNDDGNIASCFTNLNNFSPADVGEGELLLHNNLLVNGAKDNGYRYSGENPNNYICFGSGSEKYNQGETDICPDENLYRIIGYVPATINGKEEYRIKVIKDTFLMDNSSQSLLLESDNSSYRWDDDTNIWEESLLYDKLNNDFLNNSLKDNWLSKIETVSWNTGGSNSASLSSQKMYEMEMNGQGKTSSTSGKIGLMYVHDYGFASQSNTWHNNLDTPGQSNWLSKGISEWTISKFSQNTSHVFSINSLGLC